MTKTKKEPRNAWLTSRVDRETSREICEQLTNLCHEDENAEIKLYINSAGGEVVHANAIIDIIQSITSPVKTIGLGGVQSAALDILIAGNERCATRNTRFLIHESTWELSGCTLEEYKIELAEAEKRNTVSGKIIKEFTNIPTRILKQASRENVYFDAGQALEWGVIDEIIQPDSVGK